MKLALLSSGGLGYHTCKKLIEEHNIGFMMTDKRSADIIQLAKDNEIELYIGNPRKDRAIDFIKEKEVDILITINYLFIIEQELIDVAKVLAFNIHGSLLPKYRGRTPHVWAIINDEKETGITAHKIDNDCDTGDIIKQIRIDIKENDTGSTLLAKYQENYFPLIDSILKDVRSKRVTTYKQDNAKATYFGKRTPDDGRIDWDWQFRRINNWVRAQAHPYPGAFSYYQDEKIIIDEVKRSDLGFYQNLQNGTILSTNPLVVKCNNTALQIVNYRETSSKFVINEKLN